MRYKYLPSFVKRRGRITQSQEDNLTYLSDYQITNYQEILSAKKDFTKLILEIGFGNGENTLSLAKANPDTLYIGSEVYLAGIGYLIGEVIKNDLNNIMVHSGDIRLLIETIENRKLSIIIPSSVYSLILSINLLYSQLGDDVLRQ